LRLQRHAGREGFGFNGLARSNFHARAKKGADASRAAPIAELLMARFTRAGRRDSSRDFREVIRFATVRGAALAPADGKMVAAAKPTVAVPVRTHALSSWNFAPSNQRGKLQVARKPAAEPIRLAAGNQVTAASP
jgi:hypothetical protein